MSARKTVRSKPRSKGRAARRRPLAVLAVMVLLSALLMWGVVSVTRRGPGPFRLLDPASEGDRDGEITDSDRERLREVLDSIDPAPAKR